jgi:hypothetical protein
MLRGNSVVPLVNLSERPRMSKKYGKQHRPHFEIIDWKILGGEVETVVKQPTPQVPNPTVSPPTAPINNPTQASKPKPPVTLSNETLNNMDDVKPVTTGEILNDELPW